MPPKRKAETAAPRAGRADKKVKTGPQKDVFKFKRSQWLRLKPLHRGVHLMARKDSHRNLVVLKIIKEQNSALPPPEIRALKDLGVMNRIQQPLDVVLPTPGDSIAQIIYPYLPLGDLEQWKKLNFDEKNGKAVPESFIWRMFGQISQAVAFMHGEVGPAAGTRAPIIHHDIKPMNVLVTSNGTTYPSFKLHDFELAGPRPEEEDQQYGMGGTYAWQPPENPRIKTTEADIWSLGALVYFLAAGRPPLTSIPAFMELARARYGGEDPPNARHYARPEHYYNARVPRRRPQLGRQYSEELSTWMRDCLALLPADRPTAGQLVEDMIPNVAMKMLKAAGGKNAQVDMEMKFGG